jgi:ATP-dependent DNA helicase RecQ
VLTKRDADRVTGWLRSNGIDAHAYYSGIKHPDFDDTAALRVHLEQQLLDNQIKVLVATVALGMGYDKPDLAFVIHYQAPGSVVGYYQQVGRAGRAIDIATVVLLSGAEDENIHEYFRRTAFPSEKQVGAILAALEDSDGLNIRELEARINLRQGQIAAVVKYLSVENPAPLIKQGSKWVRTAVRYRLDHDKIERLTGQREREWEQIRDYIETEGCLMEYLRSALDDPDAGPCGKCANCLGQPIVPVEVDHDFGLAAAAFLRRSEMLLETKKQVATGAFEVYGFRGNLPMDLRAEEGRVLSRWGDAGWGKMVADGKHASHFPDELVTASAEMILERWKPDPAPEWVTCVPSKNHPELVPDFARRLAGALGLPFVPVVTKIHDNEPQKQQQNRFRQCQNLDGAFGIDGATPESPVLLIDDVVDSRWTLTVVAAILRQAGSGPVLPFALADTSTTG